MWGKLFLWSADKIIVLCIPFIVKLIVAWLKEREAKQIAVEALKKAVNEKDTTYIESIVNSL